MVTGVHRQSRRYRSACTRRHLSLLSFGTSYESGIQEVQYLYSLPKRSKLRSMVADQNDKGPFAEDALAKQYLVRKRLVTLKQQITKSSMRSVNHETITDMLSWYKILLFNGFSLIRVKQRLLRRRKKELKKVFRAVRKAKSHLY